MWQDRFAHEWLWSSGNLSPLSILARVCSVNLTLRRFPTTEKENAVASHRTPKTMDDMPMPRHGIHWSVGSNIPDLTNRGVEYLMMGFAMKRGRKVLVAMSGGVDSSVAAALLREQGHEVVGCFMRLGSDDSLNNDTVEQVTKQSTQESGQEAGRPGRPHHQGCCSLNDAADARLVAAILDIPLYVMNFRRDFDRIVDYFVDQYNAGRTPNPCIRCNTWLKFGKLAAYAKSIDADFVATGHYARVDHTNGDRPGRIRRGKDLNKDQSYVLFGTKRDMLDHMLLPIGSISKVKVRQLAKRWSLPVYNKPDSQEICFVPDNDYFRLLKERTPNQIRTGRLVDQDGNVLGEHHGHQRYTIGQRRGLSISLGYPIYVTEKDSITNTITVGRPESLLAEALVAGEANWFIDPPTHTPIACEVKIRSHGPSVPATVHATSSDTFKVQFGQPQRAVSPGQAAVCYVGDHLIGGGWISESSRLAPRDESHLAKRGDTYAPHAK